MTPRLPHRRAFLQLMVAASVLPARGVAQRSTPPASKGVSLDVANRSYDVHPGGSIQEALEAAASDLINKTVRVHAGIYRPSARGEALVWFNARHDGITLEAVGDVTLTAANPEVADRQVPTFPAIVNHVVYFGDGVTRRTVFRGFKVTGANGFSTGSGQESPIEAGKVGKTLFFYADGGGIKIYARSFPTIERVVVEGNYASPCGGGVSVEHLVRSQDSVLFRGCIFRNNRTQVTGSGLDVLHNSAVTLENCLFTGNIANLGVDYVGMLTGGEYHAENGSGALTVFEGGRATVSRCTFTGNWNGVDDNGTGSSYLESVFWKNNRGGGISRGPRYEIDITDGSAVKGSFINGDVNDLRKSISPAANRIDAPDPRFDAQFVPQAPEYAKVGYRP